MRKLPGIAVAIVASVGLMSYSALGASQITGAGSTFDYPFFTKAFYEYAQKHPDVQVNYQSIGSGGGIQQFIVRTVDFGATDVPMNAEELQRAGQPVLQIPVTLGGAAIAYNLPGIPSGLRLSGPTIAAIYLGKITKWNDPQIKKLNPSIKLPDETITVVHRADGSGTTFIFTDYLCSVSHQWQEQVGKAKSVRWPAENSIGGKGNEGVAALVRQTPGAIGYVELAYVLESKMTYAEVENQAGKFVYPSIETVAAAAAQKPHVSAKDFSIVNQAGADSYPISGYSWVILYKNPSNLQRGRTLKKLMEWLVTDAQPIAKTVDYVPLPENVRQQALKVVAQMKTEPSPKQTTGARGS